MRGSWLKRVYIIVAPYRGRLAISMVTLVGLTGLGIYSPVWASRLVGEALPNLDKSLFLQCVIYLFAIQLASSGLSFLYSYQMRILGGRVVFDLRRRMYDHLQRLSLILVGGMGRVK